MEVTAGMARLCQLRADSPEDDDLRYLHQEFEKEVKFFQNDSKRFVAFFSKFLLNRRYCAVVAKCFPKLVLQILCENVSLTKQVDVQNVNKQNHLETCLVLGKLVLINPDVLQFSLQYFNVFPSPFEWIHEENESRTPKLVDSIQSVEIVECCYNFLQKESNVFRKKWKWSKFISHFIKMKDANVQWLTCQCLRILLGMSEYQFEKLQKIIMGKSELNVQHYFTSKSLQNILTNYDINSVESNEKTPILSNHVVDVSGILLPVFDITHKQNGSLVLVKSTVDNLRSLALTVVSGKAACLVGPVGSGKTVLVEHLARIVGRSSDTLKKVQLGDQTDSRSLLGTYRCTDIPGEFIWQPGVLTQAVQRGDWLLMEDIDCAATDIASVLSSLLERNVLSVPGYRDSIPVAPGFQLFFTQRTISTVSGHRKSQSNSVVLLQKHWTQISVEPLSRSELVSIVEELYPNLKTISTRMVDVFLLFSVGSHQSSLQNFDKTVSPLLTALSMEISEVLSLRSGRHISTRDLIKWCSRATIDFNVKSQESALKVLQDAIDIFVCSIPNATSRKTLSIAIGAILGIVESKAEYYCDSYKPSLSFNPNNIHIGRTVISRKQNNISELNLNEKRVPFSFTRPSTCLLERISCCINMKEPILLVGETGTGKTSSIQYLAKETGNKLLVINMNQQSDSADLLGGYKPVDIKYIISPIRNEFEYLFRSYFNVSKNGQYLEYISLCFNASNWEVLLKLMKQSQVAAMKRLESDENLLKSRKRKHDDTNSLISKDQIKSDWLRFGQKLKKLECQLKSQSSLAFSFIEGSLIKALKEGYWVLLDEINLASAETLECLSGLLESHVNSINLIERGDDFYIKRHQEFKLFACMNPATDVGKRELPIGLRNRFTEFFVDELSDKNDFLLLIGDYLRDLSLPRSVFETIYKFYITIGKEAKISLMDGTGQSPHYSLRTLCRALTAAVKANCGTVTRSLYESMCLSFLTQLDSSSHPKVQSLIALAVLGKKSLRSILQQPIPEPKIENQQFLSFEGFWICKGSLEPIIPDDYILTPSVRKNLKDLARIISLGNLPILLQGDTSVGKTSLITYLAKASGNHCVRINNHQHTDIQEYVGSYATDLSGKLIFREGVLVEAMRKGYWIILDELNLAPSDVLEALNRVLDDNRELFIPETQQVVKANSKFMLFATQNPPGLYGGRNLLSRAFRNRFVELHFDDIPKPELETILEKRCHMPASYCKKVLAVMSELQVRRKVSAAVQGKEGFITLRDLFRWGQRYKLASDCDSSVGKYYDWEQHIADEGYLVLAGKVRQADERVIIQEVLQKYLKREVNPENLFSLHANTSSVTKDVLKSILQIEGESFKNIVWTFNMRKLAVVVAKSFYFQEPVLLVGETGCGKTTVCQILAYLRKSNLLSVNCHMHTEGSDFLGGLRPVRQHNDDGRIFEWVDGPLVNAMNSGCVFLADEISLADDSVLERLNSLLEPERQILLSEKGTDSENNSAQIVVAANEFRFIATMNPGGDYGKKELSPALRNRFTEIWCDTTTSREDLHSVLLNNLNFKNVDQNKATTICNCILDFVEWCKVSKFAETFNCSIRDLLSWIDFINKVIDQDQISVYEAYLHGASLVFLDGFGVSVLSVNDNNSNLKDLKNEAVRFLVNQMISIDKINMKNYEKLLLNTDEELIAEKRNMKFGINPFFVECFENQNNIESTESHFNFTAPTTGVNTLRILRGLQLKKAILLEGSPGVGKTSLVTALAKISGHKILRINLSDQTDISDLFGADLPAADGSFTWKDGAFLTALKNGDWILLDELNLAPQPVLEGLNACLDHRGEIFVPELNKTFTVTANTKIFACQNPLRQGGARRGLPKSFLNRFTQVYIDTLSTADLEFILISQYPLIPQNLLNAMIKFNNKILKDTTDLLWGYKGSPWELNLRDIQRWCDGIMMEYSQDSIFSENLVKDVNHFKPGKFGKLLYVDRMRTKEDKSHVQQIYEDIFSKELLMPNDYLTVYFTKERIHIGDTSIKRNIHQIYKGSQFEEELLILRHQIPVLKSLIECVQMNWLSILVGPTASGKTNCIRVLSQLLGKDLKILPVTSAMDTSDILGGFEQTDYSRHLEEISTYVDAIVLNTVQKLFLCEKIRHSIIILDKWETFCMLNNQNKFSKDEQSEETSYFLSKQKCLIQILDILYEFNEEIREKITNLKIDLQNLGDIVSRDKNTKAGGRFEWIDSILVKCLLDGSWLLVDNVNLCSSAVLDRLNCLLEPNGVLTIPERGDGYSEIKPHEDFRMFFTMDPKNGEISRAMRNRGVEIYILGNDDFHDFDITDVTPYLDLTALLQSTGLPTKYHKYFITMHKNLCSHIKGSEKPSQCQLIQASTLTCQQLLRGENELVAIVNSFSDVYIKPRTNLDFFDGKMSLGEFKINMLNDLLESVKQFSKENHFDFSLMDFSRYTYSCKRLCESSSLERIKQDSYFLNKTLSKYSSQFSDKVIFKLSHLFYNYYQYSTSSDISMRYEFINQLIRILEKRMEPNLLQWCTSLNRNIFNIIKTNYNNEYLEYPCDLSIVSQIVDNLNFEAYNNFKLHLYFKCLNSDVGFERKQIISIMDHSKHIAGGSYSDIHKGSVLIKYCYPLYNVLLKLVEEFITNGSNQISHEDFNQLLLLLSWLKRFHECCNAPLHEKSNKPNSKYILSRTSIDNLILHYSWLEKHLIKRIVSSIQSNVPLEVLNILNDIEKSLITLNSPFKTIHKRYIKLIGQPSPYPNVEMYAISHKRNDIFENALSTKYLKRIHANVKQKDLAKQKAQMALFSNIHDAFDLPRDISCEDLDLLDEEAIEDLAECDSDPVLPSESTNLFSMKMWPIQDFIIQKISNLHYIDLFYLFFENIEKSDEVAKKSSNFSSYEILMKHLHFIIDKIEFFPLKLRSIFSNSFIDYQKDNRLSLLKYSSEIWNLIIQYKNNSPTCFVEYWLNLKDDHMQNDSDGNDPMRIQYEQLPLSFPHVTYFTVKYIVNEELHVKDKNEFSDALITSALLVDWQDRLKQIIYYQNLIWKNICIFNSKNIQHKYLDAKMILINYERMVLCIEQSLIKKTKSKPSSQNDSTSRDVKSIIDNCINAIDDFYDVPNNHYTQEMIYFKNTFNELFNESADIFSKLKNALDTNENSEENNYVSILAGCLWSLFGFCNLTLLSNIGSVDETKKDELKLKYLKEDLKTVEFVLDGKILHNILSGNVCISEREAESIISYEDCNEMIPSYLDGENNVIKKEDLFRKTNVLNSNSFEPKLIELKSQISEKIENSSKGFIYRPKEPTYVELVEEYNYFLNSLGSIETVAIHYKNMKRSNLFLYEVLKTQSKNNLKVEIDFADKSVKEYSIWRYSLKNFYSKISQKFSSTFPDVVVPFINGITQLCYGLDLLKTSIKKQLTQVKYNICDVPVDIYMEKLIKFPILDLKNLDSSHLIEFISSKNFFKFVNDASQNTIINKTSETESQRLLKITFEELYCKCVSEDFIHNDSWSCLVSLLTEYVTLWQKQCDAIEKKKQEDDSIYVTKTHCNDMSEEEEAEKEINEMFPSYTDEDFRDFKISELNYEEKKQNASDKKGPDHIEMFFTKKEINFIVFLHSKLMRTYTRSEWLFRSNNEDLHCDYLTPLLERYKISASLFNNVCHGLDESFDFKVLPSLLLLIAKARGTINGEDYLEINHKGMKDVDKKPNFYHSSWVAETKKCLTILQTVKQRTGALLKEWPDFPTLKEIMMIIDRILNFSITSPVIRFLTGLELLRDKIEDWNKNAHKMNSMNDLALLIAQQIVSWRKMELSSWRDSLNHSFERFELEANKWWFHIYTLVDCYISQKPVAKNELDVNSTVLMDSQKLTRVMQDFMEKSPVVEFNKRLNIIYTIHCHVVHIEPSPQRDEVICIMWNIYKYYDQFSDMVSQKIKEKRTPIEKKLKDFVKICTWERDLSYWAVKNLVDKAHRTLYKHIKEFEGVLRIPASTCFSIEQSVDKSDDSLGIWDRSKRNTLASSHHYITDIQLYLLSAKTFKKYFDVADESDKIINIHIDLTNSVVLPKITSLTIKAKNFCKNILKNSKLPHMITDLDNFVTQVIETSNYLRALEVTPNLTKEKQKSQVKGFLQQKKKALSDLFHTLTRIGLSYRTGLMELNKKNGEIIDFLLPPIDLESTFSYLKNKRCDTSLLSFWKGCDMYFQRCISRLKGLNVVLLKPFPDIGLQNIERFKGYTAHLMVMIQEQKYKLIKYSQMFCYLRHKIIYFNELCEPNHNTSEQKSFDHCKNVKDTYNMIITTVEQFDLILQAIPSNTDCNDSEEIDINFDHAVLGSLKKCFKHDSVWNSVKENVKQILGLSYKQRHILNEVSQSFPVTFEYNEKIKYGITHKYTQIQIDMISKAVAVIIDIKRKIFGIISEFCGDVNETNFYNPIINSLLNLNEYIDTKLSDFQSEICPKERSSDTDLPQNFCAELETLIKQILVVIQENHKNISGNSEENGEIEENDNEILENLLKKELLQNLNNDISNMNINQMCMSLDSLLSKYHNIVAEDTDDCKKQLLKCVPLLEQISLFIQFFITQQIAAHRVSCKMLSVILNIFIELSSKGFCMPAESSDESQEDGCGNRKGGLGLGEGEGQKDVSEEIENQDQLDDALKPGEEKNKDNKDCKEESKGIEMTDDFDANLQDVEGKNEDSENSDNDDDNADKQMGETDGGAEKFDEQFWGSDDEDDESNENTNQEKEDYGKGEQLEDKKLGAKDDKLNNEDDVMDNETKESKQKNDINEMNEPDYDEDHVDPYHGNQKPLPEPEPMDLPDNMNLDEDEQNNDNEDDSENKNPFEIDCMKDQKSEEDDKNAESEEKQNKENTQEKENYQDDENNESSSDTEMDDQKNKTEMEDDNIDDDNLENNADTNADENADENVDNETADETADNHQADDVLRNETEDTNVSEDNNETPPALNSESSYDKPSTEEKIESASLEKGSKDLTQTNSQIDKEKEPAPFEQSQEQEGDEQDGIGQSELSQNQKGHVGNRKDKPQSNFKDQAQNKKDKQIEKRSRPGDTEEERALGEVKEPCQKRSKTLNVENKDQDSKENEEDGAGDDGDSNVDIYQHVKEGKESDSQIVDAATDEQASKQPVLDKSEDEPSEDLKPDDDVLMDTTEDLDMKETSNKIDPEKLEQEKHKKSEKQSNKGEFVDETTEINIEVDGENISTIGVERGLETTYHTKLDKISPLFGEHNKSSVTAMSIHENLKNQTIGNVNLGESSTWHSLWGKTSTQAKLLTEKLRLVLEPTGLSRLAGDYRTGKRINMRRVIPYIASHFRKDRIWLRRTRPAKREYHITVAIDDSSSMCDNQSKELAFESLALVSQALNLLEAGDLSVLSFGEDTKILHSFNEQFTENSGSKLIHNLTFEQKKTRIAQMLDFASTMFEEMCFASNAPNAKLLLIVSDGRGIFSEGEAKVCQTVRRVRQQGIFMIYLIVDNPINKTSIMDIKVPLFDLETNQLKSIQPYLDSFPFPFYIILRDITSLPSVLSDAMRQWFELASNMDK